MKIYGDSRSGNCLKVKYVCDYIGHSYNWQEIDVLSGATRTAEFLAINPAGQIPVAVFDDDRVLAQSGAIIRYLARDSDLLPSDPWHSAKMDEWLFWEQYSHEPSIAVVRFHVALQGKEQADCDPTLVSKGNTALDLMENFLSKQLYLVNDKLSLADVALLAYTQFAEEGGFSLKKRPYIRSWIDRVRSALGQ